jgi:chemotaxis protein MotB
MTLLLCFFIVMYAFALVDLAKFLDLKVGVSAAFGQANPVTDNTESVLADGTGILPEIGSLPVKPTEAEAAAGEAAREALKEAGEVTAENAEVLRALLESEFRQLGAAEYVDVATDDRGVVIRFDGRVLFASGDADLDPNGLAVLATAADVLEVVDNPLEIEGHTDNQAVAVDWISNWELSSARAATVVRWLIDYGQLPGPRLMAVGRADTRPRADNTTAEGRAQNRRVEIVVRVAGGAVAGDGENPAAPEPIESSDGADG